jgi:hypothetical protein
MGISNMVTLQATVFATFNDASSASIGLSDPLECSRVAPLKKLHKNGLWVKSVSGLWDRIRNTSFFFVTWEWA